MRKSFMSNWVSRTICFSVSAALGGLFLLWVTPPLCLGQTSAKESVKTLYQEYRKLEAQGRYREAIPYAEDLVRVGKEAFGEAHPHVGLFLSNLAGLYLVIGDFGKAEAFYKDSLAIREKALGPKHPDVAQSLNNLGLIYCTRGEYRKARSLYNRSLEIMERAFGSEHPDVASIANNLADLYVETHDFKMAEALYKKVVAIREKALGPRHLGVASGLKDLAEVYYALGEYDQAAKASKSSLEILEAAYGANHPKVAANLNDLAVLYRKMGDLRTSENLSRRSLQIQERVLGPEDPKVATGLNNLAMVYYMMGDYKRAEPLYKRSLEIMERAFGSGNVEVAACLGNLAMLYKSAGDYGQAETCLKRSLKITEKALGPNHPDVAISLNNLGGLYKSLGEYEQAKRMYNRSLRIMEGAFGKEHPDVAKVLNNLGGFYLTFGQYATAECCYKRSLEIKKKAFGSAHPSVALGLNNLGQVYKAVGDYGKAARLYEMSVEISADAFGKAHPQVAYALSNLGIIYRTLGDYEKAERLYKRCLSIEKSVYGPKHTAVALSLGNIAELDVARGRYESAELAYKEAIAIQKQAFGPEHPDVAKSLNNLALLYHVLGDYGKAKTLFDESLALWKSAFGPKHPFVSGFLNNQAILRAAEDDFETSHLLFNQLHEIDDDSIDQVMGFTSDEQKTRFLAMKQWSLYCFISLVQKHLADDMSSKIDAFNVWLRRKGLILEAQKRFQEAVVSAEDVEAVKILLDLSRVRTQLSTLVFAGPGKESPAVFKKRMGDLREHKEALEAKLSRVSRRFALKQKKATADCEKVAGALPPHTALIEFVRVPFYNFKAKGKEKKWGPWRYLVFILHAGKGDTVGLVDLGKADTIDTAVAGLRQEMSKTKGGEGIKTEEWCEKLHDLVFEPLKKDLGDVREVFISPDATLNLIPFEILQNPDGKYLIEDYTFNYLGAGRDLLGFGRHRERGGKSLLMGDPDFDMRAEERKTTLGKPPAAEGEEGTPPKRSVETEHLHFSRLPGTKEEVEAIYRLLGEKRACLYTGKNAVEEVIRESEAPEIVHLATHGFFLKDATPVYPGGDSAYRGLKTVQVFGTPAEAPVKIKNPLLRSGIALAGANTTLRSSSRQESDGILTAEKILGINLQGTNMVVLSACETGIGEVECGEGVYGLRRAFTQAGAKSLIMSMWAVPDRETKELMVALYENILSGKMNRCQALRKAALRQLDAARKRHGHTSPLYWGGFVFLGEP